MTALTRIANATSYGDLVHLNRAEAVAVYVIESNAGLVLVDPGPSTTREALEYLLASLGSSVQDVRHVLLTHIHLDHAGIAGTLARSNSRLMVHVHERGAPHLLDPTRLLESARRIYGEKMATLWGEFLPVPREQLQVLAGGESLRFGQHRYAVAYTPGHAVHHVSFLDEHSGLAFVGDVAGETSQHQTPAVPASPPPDIDLTSWRAALDVVSAWQPTQLLLTHYGPVPHVRQHIEELWSRVLEWSECVRVGLESPHTDEARASAFVDEQLEVLSRGLSDAQIAHFKPESMKASWYGLARYWRKRAQAGASDA